MPISLERYSEETPSEEARILTILNKQPLQAYTLDDLTPKAQNTLIRALLYLSVLKTLEEMTKKNLIESKNVQSVKYYVSKQASGETAKPRLYHPK